MNNNTIKMKNILIDWKRTFIFYKSVCKIHANTQFILPLPLTLFLKIFQISIMKRNISIFYALLALWGTCADSFFKLY